MRLYSPAKLNLFFRVLSKRSDGYHEIASLYQAIDLFDLLVFYLGKSDEMTCSDTSLPCDDSNLVMKAIRIFKSRFPVLRGVRIHLEKRIPMQAGLGGASSNAATTLWGLNELAGRPAGLAELIELGALLGSDVPFFFSMGTAYCTGRGEIMESYLLPSPLNGWIAKPDFGLSTPLVYKETRVGELPLRDPRCDLERFPVFYNDLEPAACRVEPRLLMFRNELEKRGFETVTLTGSGTGFFCVGQGGSSGLIPFCSIQREHGAWYNRLLA